MKKILTVLLALTTAIGMNSYKVFANDCAADEPDTECIFEALDAADNDMEGLESDEGSGLSWSFDDNILVKFNKNKARVTYEKPGFFKKFAVTVGSFLASGISFALVAKNNAWLQNVVDKCDDLVKSTISYVNDAMQKGFGVKFTFTRRVYL